MIRLKNIGFVLLMVVLGVGMAFADMDDDLIKAAKDGELYQVQILMTKGADINASDTKTGNTALHLAAIRGHLKVVKYLLTKGADVNAKTKGGFTALHNATWIGYFDIIKYLVSKGADINVKIKVKVVLFPGYTALHLAAAGGHLDIAKYLIKKGADVNAKNKDGKTPKAEFLNSLGATKLMWYAGIGYSKTVVSLISKGKEIDKEDNNGNTALYYAAKFNNLNSVKTLVKNGASLKKKNENGETPLHWAVLSGNVEIVKYFLEKGARIYKEDNDGKTPLHWAVLSGNVDMVQYLIEKGADVNAKDSAGFTPFHRAMMDGTVDMAKYLLSKDTEVDIDVKIEWDEGKKSGTFLHYVIWKNNIDMVKLLVSKGADINAKNNYNTTPVELARKNNNVDILKYFEKIEKEAEEKRIQAEKDAEAKRIQEEKEYIDSIFKFVENNNLSGLKGILGENSWHSIESEDGFSLLEKASYYGSFEIVKYLIENGAKDTKDKKALKIAKNRGHKNIINYFNKIIQAEEEAEAKRIQAEEEAEAKRIQTKKKKKRQSMLDYRFLAGVGLASFDYSSDYSDIMSLSFYYPLAKIGFLFSYADTVGFQLGLDTKFTIVQLTGYDNNSYFYTGSFFTAIVHADLLYNFLKTTMANTEPKSAIYIGVGYTYNSYAYETLATTKYNITTGKTETIDAIKYGYSGFDIVGVLGFNILDYGNIQASITPHYFIATVSFSFSLKKSKYGSVSSNKY